MSESQNGPMLFFAHVGTAESMPREQIPEGYTFELWRPTRQHPLPPAPTKADHVYSAFHRFKVFRNRDYAQLIVRSDQVVAHRTYIFPAFFRFPFMKPADVQMGNLHTEPAHRGKGIASWAAMEIVHTFAAPNRTIWYLTEESNVASARTAAKAGLRLVGKGERTKRFGLRLFGQFVLKQEIK